MECCPMNVDCNAQLFAAPQCADPLWFLCTNYQPNIPGYVPNDPGYWCCPTGTQCLVSPEAGFVCSAENNGNIPGLTVLSGQAPTQASTATTLPGQTPTRQTAPGPITVGTKTSSTTVPSVTKNSAIKTSSFPLVPAGLGIFIVQALFAITHVVLV